MCSEKPTFSIKNSPYHWPWCSLCKRGCRPQQVQKKAYHVKSKERLTMNGNFCSSILRNEHERSFLPNIRHGLHSLTHIHSDEAKAHMRRTPRHLHAKQWNEPPNYQVHTCCQYKGEAILGQLEENRQTLRERRSNLRHILSLLARASPAQHPWTPFLNHSNLSCSCLCAWARFSIGLEPSGI